MNKQIRQATKVQMIRRGLNQSVLAEKLELSRGHLNRMLSQTQIEKGNAKTPDSWTVLLEKLGLKLVAVPKDFSVPEEVNLEQGHHLEEIDESGMFEVKADKPRG